MIKSALKNYIRFCPYLLVITGLFAASIGIFALIMQFGVNQALESADPDAHARFIAYLADTLKNTGLREILDPNYLRALLSGLAATLEGVERFSFSRIPLLVLLAFGIVLAARELGEYLCKRRMRKAFAGKRSIKGLCATLIRLGFSLAFWAASLAIAYVWFFAIFLLPLASIVLSGIQDLLLTWVLHFRNYQLKSVFNLKNSMAVIGMRLFLQFLHYFLAAILFFSVGVLVTLLIILPLLSYNSTILNATSTDYFNGIKAAGELLRRKRKPKKTDIEEKIPAKK
ncbi:MAG: hypothetical protein LBH24_07240 [Clostridiales bacterium]|jgi:hypothetical protein|nr:hypothetical protein [Clostridiales bacterium]